MDSAALKGRIAEAFVENILRRAGYRVSRVGRETQTQRLLKINDDEFLPDFLAWKAVPSPGLERRLRTRGTDADAVISARMDRAATEISHWAEYDYVLINNDAEKCRELVHNILKAERLKATRRVFLHDFVRELIGGH